MNTLALQVQLGLEHDPYAAKTFAVGWRGGNLLKILWHGGGGTSLYVKRFEAGTFIRPTSGTCAAVAISAAQLRYLLDGLG